MSNVKTDTVNNVNFKNNLNTIQVNYNCIVEELSNENDPNEIIQNNIVNKESERFITLKYWLSLSKKESNLYDQRGFKQRVCDNLLSNHVLFSLFFKKVIDCACIYKINKNGIYAHLRLCYECNFIL